MSKKTKILRISALAINIAIAVMEVIGLVLMTKMYIGYGLHPLGYLQYYTQLSNIFSFFTATLTSVFILKNLIKNTDSIPQIIRLFKFSSVCCLTETLLVVIFVLSPMNMMGGFVPLMFEGGNLYHHFLCPILSLISFLFLDGKGNIPIKHTFFALIPTLIYGAVSVTLNIAKIWHGPYPFLYVYEQPFYISIIWAVLILGGAYAITLGVRALYNLQNKRKENSNG